MTNSVNYDYVPGQSVYVINTLGPNEEYPYWGFPYSYGGGWGFEGIQGYPGSYPRGFTSTTPAIQSGVVLQTRILFTNALLPATIMYDIRLTGELGTTCFPEDMVFPATPGVAGYQTINYGGTLTNNTVITVASPQADVVYVDGAPLMAAATAPYPTTIAALIAQLNVAFMGKAVFSLASGNIVVTSAILGTNSSIVIVSGPTPLFSTLPGFVAYETAVPGVASGLDQAQAYYATLNL